MKYGQSRVRVDAKRPQALSMTPESGSEPKFWQISLANLEQRLGADRNSLSSAEVAARRLRYSPNTWRRRLSLSLKFLSQFREAARMAAPGGGKPANRLISITMVRATYGNKRAHASSGESPWRR